MIYDLIIIGGGPAGVSSGIYSARKKIKTLVLTQDFAGQIAKTQEVENYPGVGLISGVDLMDRFKKHLMGFEIEIAEGEEAASIEKEKEIFKIKTDRGKIFESKAVIIATGRHPRVLQVPGEKEFTGRGVSYCSICDAPFFRGKNVVVVGGGNSAFSAALDLSSYAEKVFIFEITESVKADAAYQERAEKSGKIEVWTQNRISEIKGEKRVESIIYENLKTKERKEMKVGGVFIEIGGNPAANFAKNLVDLNDRGEIKIDLQTGATKTPGLFAAGDVTDVKYKQFVIAAGSGAVALLSADEFLNKL